MNIRPARGLMTLSRIARWGCPGCTWTLFVPTTDWRDYPRQWEAVLERAIEDHERLHALWPDTSEGGIA